MPSQPLVEEREARVKQIEDAAVLMHHGLKEQLRLAPHRLPEIFVEVGEAVRVGGGGIEVAKLEPLAHKVVD